MKKAYELKKRIVKTGFQIQELMRRGMASKMNGAASTLLVEILLIAIAAVLVVLYRGNITDSFNTLFAKIRESFNSVIS